MNDFTAALNEFKAAINESYKAYADRCGPTMNWSDDGSEFFGPIKEAGGRKYLRLCVGGKGGNSVYCFIAMEDDVKKRVSCGDILFPATYKTPQLKAAGRPARGSIFDPSTYTGKNLDGTGWMYR